MNQNWGRQFSNKDIHQIEAEYHAENYFRDTEYKLIIQYEDDEVELINYDYVLDDSTVLFIADDGECDCGEDYSVKYGFESQAIDLAMTHNSEMNRYEGILDASKEGLYHVTIFKDGEHVNTRYFYREFKNENREDAIYESSFQGYQKPGLYNKDNELVPVTKPWTATQTFNIVDYGAVPNDDTVDSAPAVRDAIADAVELYTLGHDGGIEIYFPEGTFYMYSRGEDLGEEARWIFRLKGVSDIAFRGEGLDKTTLFFDKMFKTDQETRAFAISESENIMVSDFRVTTPYPIDELDFREYDNTETVGAENANRTLNYIFDIVYSEKVVCKNLRLEKSARRCINLAMSRYCLIENCEFEFNLVFGGGTGYSVCMTVYGGDEDFDHIDTDRDCAFNMSRHNISYSPFRHNIVIINQVHNNLIENQHAIFGKSDHFDLAHGQREFMNEGSYSWMISPDSYRMVYLGNPSPFAYMHHCYIDGMSGVWTGIILSDVSGATMAYICDNNIVHVGLGVRLDNDPISIISNNVITKTMAAGIESRDEVTRGTIDNNVIVDNNKVGIELPEEEFIGIFHNHLRGNRDDYIFNNE